MSLIHVRFDMRWFHQTFKSWATTTTYWRVESVGFASDFDLLTAIKQSIEIDEWVIGAWGGNMPYEANLVTMRFYAMGKGFSLWHTYPLGSFIGQRFQPGEPFVVDSGQVRMKMETASHTPGHYNIIPWTYDADWDAGGLEASKIVYFQDNMNAALTPFSTYPGYIATAVIRKSNDTYEDITNTIAFGRMSSRRSRRATV